MVALKVKKNLILMTIQGEIKIILINLNFLRIYYEIFFVFYMFIVKFKCQ